MPKPTVSEAGIDRHSYFKTRHRGLSYRFQADGSKRYYGYVPGRGRVVLQARGERDALAEYGELRGKVGRGEKVPPRNVRVRDVAENWLASRTRLRRRTREDYQSALRLVVLPALGHRRLTEIDADTIAALMRGLEARGLNYVDPKRPVRPLGAAAISNYLKPLNGLLAHAARRGLIPANPFSLLGREEWPKAERREPHVWSPDEVEGLLAASQTLARQRDAKYDYSGLLYLTERLGLRLGEVTGLQWRDFDREARVLRVERQWTRAGEYAPPKTASAVRRIPLSDDVVSFLAAHRLRSEFSGDEEPIFASRNGTPLTHRNVTRRGFEAARDTAGLPGRLTFHDLRHAAASRLIAAGLSHVAVASVLGHADSSITLRVYAHLFDRERTDESIRAALGAAGV